MTKADIVANISEETGLEKVEALKAIEAFMESVKSSLAKGQNVYLRGFGSFIVKERAEKTGRNISKNTAIIIPAHNIPSFKPAKTFVEDVKKNVKVKQKRVREIRVKSIWFQYFRTLAICKDAFPLEVKHFKIEV